MALGIIIALNTNRCTMLHRYKVVSREIKQELSHRRHASTYFFIYSCLWLNYVGCLASVRLETCCEHHSAEQEKIWLLLTSS